MQIVITNDDGWGSKGILILTRLMLPFGEVTVVAPDSPQSGMSTAISVDKPLTLNRLTPEQSDNDIERALLQQAKVYVTNGTPADCVKLAINALFDGDDRRIDLLVSGINHGHNASVNIIYSGTMGACLVAAEHRIPTIGFSIDSHLPDADLHYFEPYITRLTHDFLNENRLFCYNVNAPIGEIQGIRRTRQAKGHWEKELAFHTDTDGNPYYSLIGNFVNHEPQATDTDMWCLNHGLISVQPVTLDMTDYTLL